MQAKSLFFFGGAIAWICGTFFLLVRQPDEPLLDHDEVYWIGSAYYYDLAFVKRDWQHEAWEWLPARENPPVSKYIIGLGLAIAGHRIAAIDNLAYYYLVWLRWDKNPDLQAMNPAAERRDRVIRAAGPGFRQQVLKDKRAPLQRSVVRAARDTILVCAALASLSMFLFGTVGGHGLAGLIASQLILLHPIAASAASHAMADTVALMFSIGAAGSLFLWYGRFCCTSSRRFHASILLSLLSGGMLGLACGAKMNSLVIVILGGVMIAMVAVQKCRERSSRDALRAVTYGLIMLISGVAVFAFINPAILNDFPSGLAATVTEHRYSLSAQVDLYFPHPNGLWGKLDAVVSMAFGGSPFFFLFLAMVVWCAVRHWRDLIVRFVVCWWVVAFVCVTLWLPFAWPRYTLPVLPPSILLAAYVIARILIGLLKKIRPDLLSPPATQKKALELQRGYRDPHTLMFDSQTHIGEEMQ